MSNALRVLQLNCLKLDQSKRYAVINEAIKSSNPDIGMLQEVSSWSHMEESLREAGYEHTLLQKSTDKEGAGEHVMLFSKTPWEASKWETLAPCAPVRTLTGVTEAMGVKVLAISSHSPWGAASEGARLRHNEAIEFRAQSLAFHCKTDLTVLGADLNAEPDYRSIRYLRGKDLDSAGKLSTLWTDGWNSAGKPENEATVSARDNLLAASVARQTGAIDASAVPDRRIDYLMTRGWNYGRRGGFLSFERLTHPRGLEISDHYGLVAEIQL